jgi:beta-lactamase class A
MRFAIAFLCAALLQADSPVQHLLELKMYARIKAADEQLRGVLGVATIDLTSGRIFVYNGEAVFPTASSIKIPIMVEMFHTVKDLDEKITIQPREAVGGSGNLQIDLKRGPVTLTIRQLITAMIEHSDNTATNKCIEIVHMDRVNRMLAGLGFRATRLRRIMMDAPAAERGDENTSSPLELARFVEMLYRGKLAGPAPTREMINMLKLVKADMRKVIPANVEVAAKPGDIDGVHCETGIVFLSGRPYIQSTFSTFLDENANPIGEITRIVFDYFSKLAASNEYGHKIK